jgi:uncharacterized SAM-binding protein YcdF (DUF218 family)
MRLRTFRDGICWCAAFLMAGLLIIFCTPLVRWMAGSLAVDWYEGTGDVLVILGGSMLVPGTGPRATLGYDSYLRAMYASWVLKQFRFDVIVTSGGGGLAEGMAKLLVSQGVPPQNIILETRSDSTIQNAMYVKALLEGRSMRPKKPQIAIVTSDFHCWRARAAFARYGLPVRVIPVPDVAKRCAHTPYRLEGFFAVSTELCKDLAFLVRPLPRSGQ